MKWSGHAGKIFARPSVIFNTKICSMLFGKKTIKTHFENCDIIFVDPCNCVKDNEIWEKYCDDFAENKNLDKLGVKQGVCTYVRDVYPDAIVDESTGSILGELCSDSYLLGCFRLEDVLNHNPEYAKEMEKYPESFLVIKNFTGDVVFETKKARYYDEKLPITTIIGKGSVNFHSAFVYDGVIHLHPDFFHD